MIEEKVDMKQEFLISKPLTQPIVKHSFVSRQELLTVAFKESLEVYRVDKHLHKIVHIDQSQMGNNAHAVDFAWAPDGINFCYSTSKSRVLCVNVGEPSTERKTISTFNDSRKPISHLRWFDSQHFIENSYDCLRSISAAKSAKSGTTNLLENFLKCSYSHVFSMKELLNKIQSLENVIAKGGKITILTGIDQDWTFRLSFNGILDFAKFPLAEHISALDEVRDLKYEFSNDFSKLYCLYTVAESSKHTHSLYLTTLETNDLSFYFKEFFLFCFCAQSMKDIFKNIYIGYNCSKNAINEIKAKLRNFFGETCLDDEAVLQQLTELISFKAADGDAFLKFFEGMDLKRLYDLAESVNNNFNILIDFYLESFIPSFQRMSAYLQDLKQLQIFLSSRKLECLSYDNLMSMDALIVAALKSAQALIEVLVRKKLELKNFCLFCFKWKLKASPNVRNNESEEFRNYHDAILDFELLLKYLSSPKSVFLDDLMYSYDEEAFAQGERLDCEGWVCIDKEFEMEKQLLERDIGLSISHTESPFDKIAFKGLKELLRSIDGMFNPMLDTMTKCFAKRILVRDQNVLLVDMLNGPEFHLEKDANGQIIAYFMNHSTFVKFSIVNDRLTAFKPVALQFLSPGPAHRFDYNSHADSLLVIDTQEGANNSRLFEVCNLKDFLESEKQTKEIADKGKPLLKEVLESRAVIAQTPSAQRSLNVREILDFKTNKKSTLSVYTEGKLLVLQSF